MVVDLDVEFDVAGVHTGDSNVDAADLTGIRQFVLKPNAREEPVRSRTQCVPNTKRPPRRNQETASKSDAMTTICVSKRSSPASLRRPPSSPSDERAKRGPPCVDVSLHLYGHQYSPTDGRSLRPPYFHQQTPADHEACCLTCVNVGARRRNRFRSVLVALPSAMFDSSPVGGPNTPESNMRLYR